MKSFNAAGIFTCQSINRLENVRVPLPKAKEQTIAPSGTFFCQKCTGSCTVISLTILATNKIACNFYKNSVSQFIDLVESEQQIATFVCPAYLVFSPKELVIKKGVLDISWATTQMMFLTCVHFHIYIQSRFDGKGAICSFQSFNHEETTFCTPIAGIPLAKRPDSQRKKIKDKQPTPKSNLSQETTCSPVYSDI